MERSPFHKQKRPQHIATVFNVLTRLLEIRSLQCSRDIDAYGVSGFGSAMPESKLSGAAFALHATPADSSVKSLRLWNDIPGEI